MDGKILSFNSMISDYEVINPEFAKVKVYVCYAGKNRNGSFISEEVLENMSKTIYGVPVVAEYDETNNCFKGHGGKLEISDDGIDFIQTTVPYGFVDPKSPIFYEEVTELDGITKHNYLCCYAYLWYKRYPEVEEVLRNQDNNRIGQSMEISVSSYDFNEDDDCFVIKDGHFSALCMLGVEPCFESAKVTSNFSMNDIENAYAEMLNSFKKYTIEALSDELEESEIEEFEEIQEVEDHIEEDAVETSVEEFEDNKEEGDETKEEDAKEDEAEEEEAEEEEVKEDEPQIEESSLETEDEIKDETIEEDYFKEECSRINNELISLKAKYADLETEYENLKSDYTALENEVVELREFKKAEEIKAKELEMEANIFSKFEELKEVEGYEEIHAQRFELSEKELTLRLKALAFDNGVVLGRKTKKEAKQKTKFSLDVNKETKHSEWDILNLNKKK